MGTAIKPGNRIYFVDYIRAAIVSLVILHHIAITYGASGSFYYIEPATSAVATDLLSLFTNFNQAWFLGLLFLLSGYFSPTSFDRKGPGRFLKDRLIRLGIPLLIFFFVLSPITCYIAFSHTPAAQLVASGITFPIGLNWQFYLQTIGTGPLWFVEMLLIFEFGYAAWRVAARKKEQDRPFPSYRKIAFFILLLTTASYLIRIVLPIGAEALGFPSLFDFPQYLSFFIIGLVAARGDWLRKMPSSMAKRVFGVALIATATLLVLAIAGTEKSSLGWGTLYGYGSLASAFYALWDSIFAVGMSMFVIAVFRRYFNSAGRFWKFFSQHFYAAYILQATIIVSVTAVVLSSVHIESLLKFGLASVIILPLVWAIAWLVRKIPFADRVI
ncbi:MAG TPA: acyltransferase family protein [Candidatus Limnocylindrales bacterium]|nr:acyltransferase family protein [Candidatus Limnocylindrales bacterium]